MPQWLRAKLEPNNAHRDQLDGTNPLRLMILRPRHAKVTEVEIKIYEKDLFFVRRNGRVEREQGRGSRDDLIATFKGQLKGGAFQLDPGPDATDVNPLTSLDDLTFPPSVALQIEGTPTLFRLVLNKDQKDEFERSDWDLRLEITGKRPNGKTVKYSSPHVTMVKGANTIYLHDRAENRPGQASDPKADISRDPCYSGYRRMLKRHLVILGFYRIEKLFEGAPPTRQLTWHQYARGRDVDVLQLSDRWDSELQRAIGEFHDAAAQQWRLDGDSLRFTNRSSLDPAFDLNAPEVAKEVNNRVFGDHSKRELLRWLGKDSEHVDGKRVPPRYRNPYIYSLATIHGALDGAGYGAARTVFDRKSGRILNTLVYTGDTAGADPYLEVPRFVCTSCVNYIVSQLFARGAQFSYSANAPLVDAILDLDQVSGKRSTPTFYHDLYDEGLVKPAFLIPWMHEEDPERETQTIELLKLHKYVEAHKRTRVRVFPVVREIAYPTAGPRVFTVRYTPRRCRARLRRGPTRLSAPQAGLTFLLQQHAVPWAPVRWAPTHPFQLTWSPRKQPGGRRDVAIKFHRDENLGWSGKATLLASYDAEDRFCDIRGPRHGVSPGQHYSCKCGLHKCASEVEANKLATISGRPALRDWNLVTEGVSALGLEWSTLVLFKDTNGGLQVYHSKGPYHSLQEEEGDYMDVKGVDPYFLVFSLVDNQHLIDNGINPTLMYGA